MGEEISNDGKKHKDKVDKHGRRTPGSDGGSIGIGLLQTLKSKFYNSKAKYDEKFNDAEAYPDPYSNV